MRSSTFAELTLDAAPALLPAAVHAAGVRKQFGATVAVAGLDLRVNVGEIFGLVGPDGAGKTTTFRLLLGLLKPDAGEISLAGHDVRRTPQAARAVTGYVAQQFSLYGDLSVAENIRFAAEIRGIDRRAHAERARRLLELTDLSPFTARLARDLSGGMRRKLALICSLMHEPRVLVLDEPTTGVDPVSRREFWRLLYQLPASGVTLLISTPYLDEAERCHRLGFMSQGRLLAIDTPIELLGRMPDSMVEIRTAARSQAWQWLKGRPGVRWVDAAGGALRVAFDPEGREIGDGQALARGLVENGIPVEGCDTVSARLSDVFTSLSEAGGAA